MLLIPFPPATAPKGSHSRGELSFPKRLCCSQHIRRCSWLQLYQRQLLQTHPLHPGANRSHLLALLLYLTLRPAKEEKEITSWFSKILLALTLSKLISLRSGHQNSPSSAARVSKMALQVFSKRAALFCASPFFTQCR